MTRREVRARSREELLEDFPIEDLLPGWYFRQTETSNSAWLVEGCDRWGRQVSRSGADPTALLDLCVDDARHISASVR